jgi:hypothetical protein
MSEALRAEESLGEDVAEGILKETSTPEFLAREPGFTSSDEFNGEYVKEWETH